MALQFTATKEQASALEGLAYHVADVSYITERYGTDEPEWQKAHQNVLMTFDHLDALQVPFWVQNSVIAFARDWRRFKQIYMSDWLAKNRNIYL